MIERKSLRQQIEEYLVCRQNEEEAEIWDKELKRFGNNLSHVVGYSVNPSSLEIEIEGLRFSGRNNRLYLVGNCPQCGVRKEREVALKPTRISQIDELSWHFKIIMGTCMAKVCIARSNV